MAEQTEQTPEQKEPVPGSPEYNEMMAAKFREARGTKEAGYPETKTEVEETPVETPKAPEGIPAKFVREDGTVDVEALAKSYAELERQRSPKPAEGEPKAGEGQTTEDDKGAAQAAAEAGLDYNALTAKVQENGDLDDADYAAFEKVGIPREVVQDYIQLRQDAFERTRAAALDYVGGEEAATDLMGWAAQNLSAPEIDAYNAMLAGPQWKAAIDTLKTLRGSAKPTAQEPNLRRAAGSATGSTTGYVSRDEMRADMANPLYHENSPKGEQFRAEVQRKMAFAAWRRG